MCSKRFVILGIILGVIFPMISPAQADAPASTFVQGMVLGFPTRRSVAYQDQLIAQLKANNIHFGRCWIGPDPKDIDLAKRLYAAGIQLDVLLKPVNVPGAQMRPLDSTRADMYAPFKLSDASPELSKKAFQTIVSQFDANGIKAAGFELGNEINWTAFNGDFPLPGEGKTFELQDLNSDPEAQQVAKGLLQYLKILAVLKEVRDQSSVNKQTPIILGGLTTLSGPDSHPKFQEDVVSIGATLEFLQQNGLDNWVDAYGIHIYPHAKTPDEIKSDMETHYLSECGKTKPCWITEWGFSNPDFNCPVNDDARAVLVQYVMDDFRQYVKEGKITASLYFCWDTDPSAKKQSPRTIYRCGQMTKSGVEAMQPLTQ